MKRTFIFLTFIIIQFFPTILYAQKSSFLELPNYKSNVYCFTISQEDYTLYYSAGDKIVRYSLNQKEVVKVLDIHVDSPVISIQAKASSDLIFLGTKAGKVIVISTGTGEQIFEMDYKSGSVNALAITSDGSSLLCGCENGMVYKHSIEELSVVTEFYEHDGPITSIVVSEEKQLIAISSGDGTISLFRQQTFEWIDKLTVGKKWVREVVFNENKNRLLSVGDDSRVREWIISDDKKAQLMHDVRVSKNWVLCIDVGSEGKVVCWGGLDQVLKVRTDFGTYTQKLKGAILEANFLYTSSYETVVVCCVLGRGIQIVPIKDMKFKSIYY